MSDKKNSAVQKALAELGLREQPVLTPEQEEQLTLALDPEQRRLQDIMDVFTPKDS